MDELDLTFSVAYRHRILFTEDAFAASNPTLASLVGDAKVLPLLDSGLAESRPGLAAEMATYAAARGIAFSRPPLVLTGGEAAKRDSSVVKAVLAAIESDRICRHSYVLAVGGGAFLDAVGFAAATAHRGVRVIRMPSTTLGQGDAGVGVKNGINTFGKKNFTGAFAVPAAVVNDLSLLASLDLRGRRDGLVEAVKVALLKDAAFLAALEAEAPALAQGDLPAIGRAIRRSAELHARHIASGGDPFELGSARPLDLGHWSAHKLESMTSHRLTHGEAVAVGLALDTLCARDLGLLAPDAAERVLRLLAALGFRTYAEELHLDGGAPLLAGLEEFREHLGGRLTLVLPVAIGASTEVHALSAERVRAAADELMARDTASCAARS
jgi:3-dehydroquinate synthase